MNEWMFFYMLQNVLWLVKKRLVKKKKKTVQEKRIEHDVCTQESQAATITASSGTMRPRCSLDANLS